MKAKMTKTKDGDNAKSEQPKPASPVIRVLVQYIKDMSFENPKAPGSLQPNGQPKIDIDVNVNATPIGKGQFEASLQINAKATKEKSVLFNIELAYAGIFQITGVSQDHLYPVLMIECPRILFPFARQIVSDATRNGGFPPLFIDPIDFATMYRKNLANKNVKKRPEIQVN